MKTSNIYIMISLIIGMILFFGCTPQESIQEPIINTTDDIVPENSDTDASPVEPEIPPVEDIPEEPEIIDEPIEFTNEDILTVVDANNLFAMDLYARYSSEEGNVFFSPHSISSALAMTYEGARMQTAEEMRTVLYLPEDDDIARKGFFGINVYINREDKDYQLSVANALWAQKNYPFKEDYLDSVERHYGGKVTNLNFKTETEKSRVTINDWVEDKTYDRIKDLIPKGALNEYTKLVLTNAIYFKAKWYEQFDEERTTDGEFTLDSGQKVDARMMHQTGHFYYGETKDIQFLELQYVGKEYRGNDLSMLIILPKEDKMREVENTFTMEKLDEWKGMMNRDLVELTLPRFKFETKYMMRNDLKEMGMPTAFNPDNADFTSMYDKALANNENLYISEVIHQTFIAVEENGTEAAAATAVIMASITSLPSEPPIPKVFNAEHPFIFIIQQVDNGNILFMGRLSDPS